MPLRDVLPSAGVALNRVPPTAFVVVSLVSTLFLLASWRGTYAVLRGSETATTRRGGVFDGINMVTTLLRRW